jgi:hypothetical protein
MTVRHGRFKMASRLRQANIQKSNIKQWQCTTLVAADTIAAHHTDIALIAGSRTFKQPPVPSLMHHRQLMTVG